jgi:hypothetical protein
VRSACDGGGAALCRTAEMGLLLLNSCGGDGWLRRVAGTADHVSTPADAGLGATHCRRAAAAPLLPLTVLAAWGGEQRDRSTTTFGMAFAVWVLRCSSAVCGAAAEAPSGEEDVARWRSSVRRSHSVSPPRAGRPSQLRRANASRESTLRRRIKSALSSQSEGQNCVPLEVATAEGVAAQRTAHSAAEQQESRAAAGCAIYSVQLYM